MFSMRIQVIYTSVPELPRLVSYLHRSKNERGVGSTETERIRHGVAHRNRHCFIADYTETLRFFVEVVHVGRRRGNLVSQSKDGDSRFEAAGAAEQMTRHGFRGTDEQVFRVIAESGGNCQGFCTVAKGRRGGMGIQILHIGWRESSILQSELHDPADTASIFGRGVRMEGVGVRAVADEFCKNHGATANCVLALFENHDAGAFTDDKAVACGIPRAGSAGRIVIACRESPHGSKAGHRERRDGSLATAAYHGVGIAPLEDTESFANSVRPSGACSGYCKIRPGCSVPDRYLPRGKVCNCGRNEEG